jgi:lipoprotein-releasing system permease protein
MRYEFAVAAKYLIPRTKQLSVSIISLISLLVISLVIWLVLVFMSVTDGLEKTWINKIVSVSAPLRVTPNELYFKSYYHNIDSLSAKSSYRTKSLKEKLASDETDPYDPNVDSQIPSDWQEKDLNDKGLLWDIVKDTYSIIQTLPGVKTDLFEVNVAQLVFDQNPIQDFDRMYTNQIAYFVSIPENSPNFKKNCCPITGEDAKNLLNNLVDKQEDLSENTSTICSFFENCEVEGLKAQKGGWLIEKSILPQNSPLKAIGMLPGPQRLIFCKDNEETLSLLNLLKQSGYQAKLGTFIIKEGALFFDDEELSEDTPLVLNQYTSLKAILDKTSLETADYIYDIKFDVDDLLQNEPLKGKVHLTRSLTFDNVLLKSHFENEPINPPKWPYNLNNQTKLQEDDTLGDPLLLSKQYKDSGIKVGQTASIIYNAATTSGLKEMKIKVYVAGFFESGLTPAGAKLVMADTNIVSELQQLDSRPFLNGFQIWFDDYKKADAHKSHLIQKLTDEGLIKYFNVESYRDYDFAKDFVEQLQSDKTLFSLMAIIIIVVACSNIISMLILLVNDKKREIGILQSMGASPQSIALIFGTCGVILGLLSSLIGTLAAFWTLHNIDVIVNFLSFIQGHEAFKAAYFGDSLPNTMSSNALSMVWIATAIISLLAGLVPAIKASSMKPTAILRSE